MRTPFCMFLGLAVGCLSCGPERPPVPPPVVHSIGVRDLHNSYLDGSDRWTGQRVRVTLRPGQFRSVEGRTCWYGERVGGVPSVVWDCSCPEGRTVTVIGTCSGRVASADGWYVSVVSAAPESVRTHP